jgi:hypothetical protein
MNMLSKWSSRLPVIIMMKIQLKVFSVLMPCSNVVVYQHFRVPCCLYFTLKMEVGYSSEHWYFTTWLHSITTHKTITWTLKKCLLQIGVHISTIIYWDTNLGIFSLFIHRFDTLWEHNGGYRDIQHLYIHCHSQSQGASVSPDLESSPDHIFSCHPHSHIATFVVLSTQQEEE